MNKCATIPFLPEFSGCLVENPSCTFAVRCGFSYHCEHPHHTEYEAGSDNLYDRKDLPTYYRNLKESRRRKYLAEVGGSHEIADFIKNNSEYLTVFQQR